MLKIKVTKDISDDTGNINTDNLSSYFTGDINELFTEEKILKPYKSKVNIVLDSSGSMRSSLYDNKTRYVVVAKTAQSIVNILKRINENEGLNIEWEVNAFSVHYQKLNKDNWQREYANSIGNGTRFYDSFVEAQKDMLSNPDIVGKKIIIFITDGRVDQGQIENIRKHILKYNEDIRF